MNPIGEMERVRVVDTIGEMEVEYHFSDDVKLGVCIALVKDEQPDICEIYPFIEVIK